MDQPPQYPLGFPRCCQHLHPSLGCSLQNSRGISGISRSQPGWEQVVEGWEPPELQLELLSPSWLCQPHSGTGTTLGSATP